MTKTAWSDYHEEATYPALVDNMQTDSLIVGGGMAGILSAYLLMKKGKKVVLMEKYKIGQGATHLTTAFLTASIDTDFSDLIKSFGLKNSKLIIASHQSAVDLIEKIAEENKIDCDFMRCSNFIYGNSAKDDKELKREYDALLKLGLKAEFVPYSKQKALKYASLKSSSDLPLEKAALQRPLGINAFGYIEIFNQAKFHPLKFLYSVARICHENGVKIFENSGIKDIIWTNNSAIALSENGHVIKADQALVATHEPFNQPLYLYFKKGTYKTYAMEMIVKRLPLKTGTYEDIANPYHYFRVGKVFESEYPRTYRVIVGGEDHRRDIHLDPKKRFEALQEYVDKIFGRENYEIIRRWSGPILEPIDGIAYIGFIKEKERIMYATAFSGNGMTYSGITAMIFSDVSAGIKNPLEKIYDPKRLPGLKALAVKGKDYSEELINGVIQNLFKI